MRSTPGPGRVPPGARRDGGPFGDGAARPVRRSAAVGRAFRRWWPVVRRLGWVAVAFPGSRCQAGAGAGPTGAQPAAGSTARPQASAASDAADVDHRPGAPGPRRPTPRRCRRADRPPGHAACGSRVRDAGTRRSAARSRCAAGRPADRPPRSPAQRDDRDGPRAVGSGRPDPADDDAAAVLRLESPTELAERTRDRNVATGSAGPDCRRSSTGTATAPSRRSTSVCPAGPRTRPISSAYWPTTCVSTTPAGLPTRCSPGAPRRPRQWSRTLTDRARRRGPVRARTVRFALDRTRRLAGIRELPKFDIVLVLARGAARAARDRSGAGRCRPARAGAGRLLPRPGRGPCRACGSRPARRRRRPTRRPRPGDGPTARAASPALATAPNQKLERAPRRPQTVRWSASPRPAARRPAPRAWCSIPTAHTSRPARSSSRHPPTQVGRRCSSPQADW